MGIFLLSRKCRFTGKQKKLEGLKKNLDPLGKEKDMEERIFSQMGKKKKVVHVQTLLEGRKTSEKTCEKNQKLINTIDVYVKIFLN